MISMSHHVLRIGPHVTALLKQVFKVCLSMGDKSGHNHLHTERREKRNANNDTINDVRMFDMYFETTIFSSNTEHGLNSGWNYI